MINITTLILCGLAALGWFSHNNAITWSMLFLLMIKLTPLNQFFPYIEKNGLNLGIIILTIGVMAPLASEKISSDLILNSFLSWKSILAIVVGLFVSWVGAGGVSLMKSQPDVVAGLLIGTLMGVALLKGVPVGPLIAAGLLSMVYKVV
ncbi:DUF441 domain-containing protein [Aeromonas sp.]|uniref:DUF441 domain-containing protein n=1 Tax=Aeromonas sp. TaxID=647 RepID=UPI0025852421|nr:DUF441 domain-containing protein [Aeromonas sp.]MCX7132100.1 DUF441 domain-containing protein [Aeromonas sp.]